MAQRFGTIVASALAGVLALGTMAGTARAQVPTRDTSRAHVQDSTHRARTTPRKATRNHPTRNDTSAYRAMATDSARARDTVIVKPDTAVPPDTTVRPDTTMRPDTTGAHINRDSAQTSPRATTTKGLPGVEGPPAGAGSPGIVTSADTTGQGANGAGGKPGAPPVTAPRTDTVTTTTAPTTTPPR